MIDQPKAWGVLLCEFGGLMFFNSLGGMAAARRFGEPGADQGSRFATSTEENPFGLAGEAIAEDMAIMAFAKVVFSLAFIAAGFMLLAGPKEIKHKNCIPARFIGMRPPGSLVWPRYQVRLRSRK